jgi:hypothetical protein
MYTSLGSASSSATVTVAHRSPVGEPPSALVNHRVGEGTEVPPRSGFARLGGPSRAVADDEIQTIARGLG